MDMKWTPRTLEIEPYKYIFITLKTNIYLTSNNNCHEVTKVINGMIYGSVWRLVAYQELIEVIEGFCERIDEIYYNWVPFLLLIPKTFIKILSSIEFSFT